MVEMWFVNEKSDNISRHKEYVEFGRIEELIDISLFNGKLEGDTVSIKGKNHLGEYELVVTLNQSKYRYRSFGTFDYILTSLKKRGEPNWSMALEDYYSKQELKKMYYKLVKDS